MFSGKKDLLLQFSIRKMFVLRVVVVKYSQSLEGKRFFAMHHLELNGGGILLRVPSLWNQEFGSSGSGVGIG